MLTQIFILMYDKLPFTHKISATTGLKCWDIWLSLNNKVAMLPKGHFERTFGILKFSQKMNK